ncbi:MAG: DUF1722 domain-containing protein [Candidatus Cloacimonadota bacterium]|nr:DUF1722 domain-containing protein [Candidatus Cloacimonadota bacterium]
MEDEGRLTNLRIREHFFTKIFLYAQFDSLPVKMRALVDFHSRNKYMFMAYNQYFLKKAGQVVGNHNQLSVEEVFKQYRYYLHQIMHRRARFTSHINVLMHLLGYFSHDISFQGKQHFLQQLELYKADEFSAEISGHEEILIDYYVEATDKNGNVAKSPIQHVWVGEINGSEWMANSG